MHSHIDGVMMPLIDCTAVRRCQEDRQEDSSPSPSSVLLQRYNCNEMLPGMEEIDVSKILEEMGNQIGVVVYYCCIYLYIFLHRLHLPSNG